MIYLDNWKSPSLLLEDRQMARGFDEMSLSKAGSKHKRNSSPESEGLDAGPAHVDSEDSSAPKRKCISLNRGGFEGFDVPIEVFTLSKLSSAERKSLEHKLRSEVEKIRQLQRRLPSANSSVKKQGFMGVKGPESYNKPTLPAAQAGTSHLLLMKQCETLLKRLMSHKNAWVFSTPVDVVKFNIPDYYDIIKHPMDLGTVKSKLATGAYTSAWNFAADVRLTFTNAMTYNPPTNSVHLMADAMGRFFETRWKPIEKKLVMADASAKREEPKRVEPSKPVLASQPKKKQTPALVETSPVVMEKIKPKMTIEERQNLGDRLASVSAELPVYIIDFLRQCCGNTDPAGEDELEIDIDLLGDDMLFELQKLLDRYMEEKKRGGQEKADVCEVEVLNVSGLSNSSMHPCKVNEPMEEDVDICGDDAPVTSYPPICIEKETQGRGSKCSTSSSSSDSGSSSSDSDSSNSSADSHERRVSPSKVSKEIAKSEHNAEQEKSDVISSLDRPVSGLTIPDQDAQSKPESIGANSNPEGESERQASPEKLYRAALLRGRFADTIVKAHEKMLAQGDEKGDPEKLRRAKEELERQQREEKARILAEAKAVEDAQKRAEAEAEAEAKRKRELEREAAREAARQALLEMEKTAVTNDAAMLRELELLRTAPAENIGSSVDETSPDNSPDGFPDFARVAGSNPLEQLGLFMKVDDEEEEEYDQPKAQPPPVNDEEEGEIEID
ncbi:Transcription factor GTE8 [Rhynchospora pubera]|uniref:Transcription factor GTE8 n=1 Tax=Rhynchospora pubera TaxID=906938 RepID=A0AAV8FIJ5_9POAL|nr:Transcription factor GTE8 [Rhynchospora pubera]